MGAIATLEGNDDSRKSYVEADIGSELNSGQQQSIHHNCIDHLPRLCLQIS